MSLSAGHAAKPIKPRCDGCGTGGNTHPYPKEGATPMQLRGDVMGGYDWLCPDCAYIREYPHVKVERPAMRAVRRPVAPQRERLFDL